MEEGRSSKAGQLFVGFTCRNFGPCGSGKNKKAILALLLLLALITTFLQDYHNNQRVVMPNEMVGLYYRH